MKANDTAPSSGQLRRLFRRAWHAIVSLAWIAFWFWSFSFAYSDSFFAYNPCSRLPVFGAALFGAIAVPASASLAWRWGRSLLQTLPIHLVGLVAALSPLALVSFTLSRVRGACHLEADDAMGAGIDFLILAALGAVSLAMLLVAAFVRSARAVVSR